MYVEEISLKSSVFSEVDTRINTATAGLVASNDFNAASVVAMVNGAGSSVNINADKINLTERGKRGKEKGGAGEKT